MKEYLTSPKVAPIWLTFTIESIAPVQGKVIDKPLSKDGIASFGQIIPGKNANGNDITTIASKELSLFLNKIVNLAD